MVADAERTEGGAHGESTESGLPVFRSSKGGISEELSRNTLNESITDLALRRLIPGI